MKHKPIIKRTGCRIFCCSLIAAAVLSFACAQQTVPLYPGKIPNAKNVVNQEYIDKASGQSMKVSIPELTVYIPADNKKDRTAVIICPGGGYGSLVMDREGHDVAKKLTAKGIVCFVLKYRLPDSSTMQFRYIGPLQDAQQSIKYIRQNASVYHINPNRVGIMGFSAGGHLAATAGNRFDTAFIEGKGISLRPDFTVLIYPIITMKLPPGHQGSTENLLGKNPPDTLINYFSNELQVKEQTPPSFIAYADNDQSVMNGVLFYEALHAKKVAAELHIYAKGGHGFLKQPSFDEWGGRLLHWMDQNGWRK